MSNLTKELVAKAYDAGVIEIISVAAAYGDETPSDKSPVVKIGEHWFYAFGHEGEASKVKEYLANVPKEDIINEIYMTLVCLREDEFGDEVDYYTCYMEEQLAAQSRVCS